MALERHHQARRSQLCPITFDECRKRSINRVALFRKKLLKIGNIHDILVPRPLQWESGERERKTLSAKCSCQAPRPALLHLLPPRLPCKAARSIDRLALITGSHLLCLFFTPLYPTWLSSSYYTPYLGRLLVWSFTHLEILRPCPPFFPLFSNSHQNVDVHAFFPIIILDGDLLAALALNTFSIVCFFS